MPVTEFDEVLDMELGLVPKPYEVEFHDKESINEIKNMVADGLYQDIDTVKEHLRFLEHLADKLQDAIKSEQNRGESAWSLRKIISDIKNLHNALSSLINRFSSAS